MVVALEPVVVLGALLACACMIALSLAYNNTFGAILSQLAKLGDVSLGLPHLPAIHPLRPIADAAHTIDNYIRRALGAGVAATEWALNRSLQWLAYSVQWIGEAIAGLAEDVDRAIELTISHYVPAAAKTITTTIVKPLEHTVTRTRVVTHELAHGAMKRVASLEHRVAALTGQVAAEGAGAIAGILPRIRGLERDSAQAGRRLRELERSIAGGLAVGIVLATLAKAGLGWVRCSKVGRVGRQVCGLNESLLDALVADTLLIAGTISLVELAEGMVAVTDELANAVLAGFRETRHLAG